MRVLAKLFVTLSAGIFLVISTTATAQGTGALTGAVTSVTPDGVSVFLPGAQIALSCPSAPLNSRSAATDEAGHFALQGLAPGECQLTASERGFQDEIRRVDIKENITVELNLQLKLRVIEQQATVTAQTPEIETTQTSSRQEIKVTTLEHAPLRNERFTDAIPLLPGVVRNNDGSLSIHGTRSNQTILMVNGANVTDPSTGEYGLDLPTDLVQSLQVLPNPYDAQYGDFTGAVTTVDTRSGTEKFKFEFHDFLPRFRLRAGHFVGLASVTPRVYFGGPVSKGKVFFAQSFEYQFSQTRVPGLKHLDRQVESDTKLESVESHTQLDFELNPFNHLTVTLLALPEKLGYANLNTFNPREVTPDYHQRSLHVGITERKIFADLSFLESSFFARKFDVDVLPALEVVPFMILRPEQNEGSYFNHQDRRTLRYEWQENYHVRPLTALGQHLITTGVQFTHVSYHGVNFSSPVFIERSDKTLAQLTEFIGQPLVQSSNNQPAVFYNDKWALNSRLTVDLGVRYDHDALGGNDNFAPRFGVATGLTADNRTVLRGGVGIFFDKIPLNVGTFEQLQSRRVTRFASDGVTPLAPAVQFRNMIQNSHLDNPRSVAWNIELDREVVQNFVLRAGYLQRQSRREFIIDPIMTPQPALSLSNSGRQLYREYEISARYRFKQKNEVVFAYVHSSATGDLNDFNQFFGNFENPVIRPNARSLLPFDAPNRFLAWADLRLPWDITVAPVIEVRTGFPFSLVDANQDFIGPRNRAGRFPQFVDLDLQVSKAFRIPFLLQGRKFRAGIKVFNLTDHFNPRDFQNNIDSSPVSFRSECSGFGQFCNSIDRSFGGKFVIEF